MDYTKVKYILNESKYRYKIYLALSIGLSLIGLYAILLTLFKGLNIWGINNQISWGFAIVNFVFWIGIAHAGTLISAILYLLNQNWRTEFNRIAELMTIFAIVIAAVFPLLHTGRPWYASYWLLPYFNQMKLMPNFKSALTWDISAILTYFIVSCIFLYIGLILDLAYLRKLIKNKSLRKIYSYLSSFWKGSSSQWSNYKTLYLILAGLITPLVISVHTIVSFDFYVTLIPAWHSSILPPYFVIGAILSGLAMVNIISFLMNYLFGKEIFIKLNREKINKLILFCSLCVSFVYLIEFSTPFVDNSWKSEFIPLIKYDVFSITMLILNSIVPLFFIFKRFRYNNLIVLLVSLSILLGMWIERFVIVVRGQELSTYSVENLIYNPTGIDWMLVVGSIGFFVMMLLISCRILPIKTIVENMHSKI